MRHYGALGLMALLSGCLLQAGGHLGATVHPDRPQQRNGISAAGRVESRVLLQELWPSNGLQVGLELEGRLERDSGALLTTGLQVGWSVVRGGPVGVNALLGVGGPLGWGNPMDGGYYGLTLELPVELTPLRASDVNRNYRFVDNAYGVTPYLRGRGYLLSPSDLPSAAAEHSFEFVFGIAVRSRIFTDLL